MAALKNLFQTAKTTRNQKFNSLDMREKASKNSGKIYSRHNEENEQAHHIV